MIVADLNILMGLMSLTTATLAVSTSGWDDPSDFRPPNATPGVALCGTIATATYGDLYKVTLASQRFHQKNNDWDQLMTVEAHACLRMGCKETSAMYTCNEHDYPIEISRAVAGQWAHMLVYTCTNKKKYDKEISIGATAYLDDGVSVHAGYGNCRHSVRRGPFYDKWGPHGIPYVQPAEGEGGFPVRRTPDFKDHVDGHHYNPGYHDASEDD